jgi:hypothetical protein
MKPTCEAVDDVVLHQDAQVLHPRWPHQAQPAQLWPVCVGLWPQVKQELEATAVDVGGLGDNGNSLETNACTGAQSQRAL